MDYMSFLLKIFFFGLVCCERMGVCTCMCARVCGYVSACSYHVTCIYVLLWEVQYTVYVWVQMHSIQVCIYTLVPTQGDDFFYGAADALRCYQRRHVIWWAGKLILSGHQHGERMQTHTLSSRDDKWRRRHSQRPTGAELTVSSLVTFTVG